MTCLALGVPAAAQDPADAEPADAPDPDPIEEAIPVEGGNGDDVRSQLVDIDQAHNAIVDLPSFLLAPIGAARDVVDEAIGLRLGITYSGLYQKATSANGKRDSAGLGSLDLFGRWEILGGLLRRGTSSPGRLGFAVDQRHRYTDIAPGLFGLQIGSQWRTTDFFTPRTATLAFKQLWWEQHLLDDAVVVTIGKMDPSDYYDDNRISNAYAYFANWAFSFNPTTNQPLNGLGVNFRVQPTESVYLSLGLHDQNGKPTADGFDTIGDGEYWYAAQLGFKPNIDGWGPGHYRFHGWYNNRATKTPFREGAGLSLSFDQEFGISERLVLVPFLRYAYEFEGATPTRQSLAFGLGMGGWFENWDDVAGIAFAWGEPSKRPRRHQYVSEVFYRFQIFRNVRVTPSYQVIFNPSGNRNKDVVGVFGIRFRITI